MKFTKMQGLGNDFVIVDARNLTLPTDLADWSKKLCDRHFGIGADGLMLVLPSECADIRMQILNSDGSEAEMCGNGIRCFAKFVYEEGLPHDCRNIGWPDGAGSCARCFGTGGFSDG